MQLELGRFSFDVSWRAPIIARLPADVTDDRLRAAVAERPAAIELALSTDVADAVHRAREHFAGPIIVRTGDADRAIEAARSGAAAIHDPSASSDPHLLPVIAERHLSVFVDAPEQPGRLAVLQERLAWAAAAGIETRRIAAVVGSLDEVAELDAVSLLETEDEPGVQGVHVAAVMAGVRLLAPADVVATRRTADTVAELLARQVGP